MDEPLKRGAIDVDSGMIWIGDPCYILPSTGVEVDGKIYNDSPGLLYEDLIKKTEEVQRGPELPDNFEQLSLEERAEAIRQKWGRHVDAMPFPHERGHFGRGIVVHPGGDGIYGISIERNDDGRIKRVIIEVEPEEEEDNNE